ncbi:MAG: hypothetical protein N5P05_004509 (plasmid) [Chroococcopsis gigantea SAG 12.99]|jgi:hypothetical protein|nr:hypothetical protein [Chroococcopsis gigantea SAG 12.99]
MTLYLSHFDTKLRQDLGAKERIKNCLAEYLFPDVEFALGEIDSQNVKAKDLREYEGMTLQFASRQRMYFSSFGARDLLYPNSSDGAAYGSLPFTPCKTFSEIKNVRVLVIDDSTGNSNGILSRSEALKLVGDCHGKMTPELAERLTGAKNAPFQFRLGIRPQPDCPFYRIAKGTLAPHPKLGTLTPDVVSAGDKFKTGYDLILATSSFKGRKGGDAIRPGEYVLDLGIGVKSVATYGKQSLGAQVLVNYPKGVQADILPVVKKKASDLSRAQSDLYKLAKYFLKSYEERSVTEEDYVTGDEDLDFLSPLDALSEGAEENSTGGEKLLYDLLKVDLEHHAQLLEHPFVIDQLKKFLQKQWIDIATGRAIKFHSGLAQPSLALKENEVCIPIIPDGAEVIVTRSPLVNSNGVIILVNRHLPHLMNLQGAVHIHPVTAAKHLQADFDGDRLAFERAELYPTLTEEIKEALLEDNRYPDVVKRDKVPYTGSFEKIATGAVKNDIGRIANQIMSAVTLRWETVLMPEEIKQPYVERVRDYYRFLVRREAEEQKPFQIPAQYRDNVYSIANLGDELSDEDIETALSRMREIQFRIVSDLSNELQVAVDGPKSAARPDTEMLKACKEIGGYEKVAWLTARDKIRNPGVYTEHILGSTNYGPVDAMISVTNGFWEQNQLQARPVVQFRGLFPEVKDYRMLEIAGEIKEAYNDYLKTARSLEDLRNEHRELISPYIELRSTKSDKVVYLTRLEEFGSLNSEIFDKKGSATLNLTFIPNKVTKNIPNSLLALANNDVEEKPIAAVAVTSISQYAMQPGMKLTGGLATLNSGITDERINAIYDSLDEYVEMVRGEHPDGERQSLAAALWGSAHTRDDYGTKKALLAFKLFPDEVIEQVKELQFKELSVVGLHFPTNEHGNRAWRGEVADCEIAITAIPNSNKIGGFEDKRVVKVEGKVLAPLTSESPSLPLGTKFRAAIFAEPGSSLIATTPKGNSVKIGQVKNFAYRDYRPAGETKKLTVNLVNKGGGGKMALVSVDGNALGILDKESELKLRERNLLGEKGFTFVAKLENAPPTTARIQIQADTVIYPWQLKEKERELEAKREVYRGKYETYKAEVLKNPIFSNAPPQEVDIEIAIRAYGDTKDPREVSTILSQSDTVREWRSGVPELRSWDDYINGAKSYLTVVQSAVSLRLQQQEELG